MSATAANPPVLTQARLLGLMHYDLDTGLFTWRVNKGASARAGAQAGRIGKGGYRRLKIDRREYTAGRLAWLYVTGELPKKKVSHRNGALSDDSFANLVLLESGEAQRSQKRAHRDNHTGLLGVSKRKDGLFTASIGKGNGSGTKYIGAYPDSQTAHLAYMVERERRTAQMPEGRKLKEAKDGKA